jgi:acyl-CoA-binding protein
MDDLERKFNKYISKVKKLEHVNDNNKLYLYANYKQSTEGDINIEKPSIFSIVESEKWKAWNEIKGTSKENAMKNYIKKVKDLYKE